MVFTNIKPMVIFYEKPGCAGNNKQKKLLKNQDLNLEVKDILSTNWTKDKLESFFIGLDKEEIINPFAPSIKKGLLDLNSISKDELIEKMIQEPILIKRPLMQIGTAKICGFDLGKVYKILNVC
jgi:nitrogenase-associated protein